MRILILLFTVGVVQAQVQRIDLDQITQADSKFVIKEGKIGIGTSSPSAKLDVAGGSNAAGNTNLKISSDIYPWIDFYSANTNANNRNWRIAGVSSAYGTFEILNSSAANGIPDQSRFAITKGGAVGIGNNSPTEYGSSYVNLWLGSTGKTGYLTVYNGTVNLELNADNQGVVRTRSNHPLLFGTNETERMRITSNGNVGIGTTSPSEKLHVVGNTVLGNTLAASLILRNDGTYAPAGGSSVIFKLNHGGLDIAKISNTGTGQRDGWFTLYDEGVAKVLIAANNSRGGHTYFNGGGNVGIGTTSPTSKIHASQTLSTSTSLTPILQIDAIYGSATSTGFGASIDFGGSLPGNIYLSNAARIYAYNENPNDNGFALGFATRPTAQTPPIQRLTILRQGNVGIATTSPSYTFHVNGNVAGVGGYVNLSDIDYKKNIYDLTDGLDKVLQLRPVTFNWKNIDYGDRINTGFIAQEVELVLPDVVLNAQDGVKSLATTDLIPVLTKAIQELYTIIEQQQQTINELKATINE